MADGVDHRGAVFQPHVDWLPPGTAARVKEDGSEGMRVRVIVSESV